LPNAAAKGAMEAKLKFLSVSPAPPGSPSTAASPNMPTDLLVLLCSSACPVAAARGSRGEQLRFSASDSWVRAFCARRPPPSLGSPPVGPSARRPVRPQPHEVLPLGSCVFSAREPQRFLGARVLRAPPPSRLGSPHLLVLPPRVFGTSFSPLNFGPQGFCGPQDAASPIVTRVCAHRIRGFWRLRR